MGYEKILENREFLTQLSKIKELEKDRIYCKHGLEHLLDVCRIAYIHALERELDFSKDLIYGAGLLHDIGRAKEYEENVPHDRVSVAFARQILPECDYARDDVERICAAIGEHRSDGSGDLFAGLLREADRLSRCCFVCEAEKSCKWQAEKKNRGVLS